MFKCLPCLPADFADPLVRAVCEPLKGLGLMGSPPCSAEDIAQGRFVQAGFPQNASYCTAGPALAAMGLANDVKCCNDKDLCNTVLRCYEGADSKIEMKPTRSPRCANVCSNLV